MVLVERLVGDDVADAARAAAREDGDDDDGDDADAAMEAGMSSRNAAGSDEEEASAPALFVAQLVHGAAGEPRHLRRVDACRLQD